MKLSIIIPTYNAEKYISRCLDSLLDQGLYNEDYEIILVNDGSIDNSLKIAQNYAEKYNHIIILDQKNGGVGNARNKGIDNAKGDYLYFIDPDDFLVSNCLSELVDTIERNNLNVLSFLSSSFSLMNSEVKLSKKSSLQGAFGHVKFSPIMTGEDYVATVKYNTEVWWYLIDRKFLKNSGIRFIEGRWMEDAIFITELLLKSKRIAHLELDVHRYMVFPGSAMTSKEQNHYLKIIRDNQNAALVFDRIIRKLEKKKANSDCIKRIKTRQQSFVFFSMIRMIKSTMSFKEVKLIMAELSDVKSYPLDSFLGKDYNKISYHILVRLFNRKWMFYFLFLLFNPFFKFKHILFKPV